MCVALLDYVGELEEAELEDLLLSGITLNDDPPEFHDITEEGFIAAVRDYYTPDKKAEDEEAKKESGEDAEGNPFFNLFNTN